jgi:hypothetical protein
MTSYTGKDISDILDAIGENNHSPSKHPACAAETRQRLYAIYLTKDTSVVMMLAIWVHANECLEDNFLKLMGEKYANQLEMWLVAEEVLAKYDEHHLDLTPKALLATRTVANRNTVGDNLAMRINANMIQSLVACGFTLTATTDGAQVELYRRDLRTGRALGAPALISFFDYVTRGDRETFS